MQDDLLRPSFLRSFSISTINVMQILKSSKNQLYPLVLTLGIATIFLLTNQASAADIPSKYQGVWTSQETCEISRLKTGEFPFLTVTDKTTKAHEQSCKVVDVKRAAKKDTLKLRCSGEGEEWGLTQEWSIRDKTTDVEGWITIKEPTLVIIDSGHESIYRKCAYTVCVEDQCWGEQ